MGADIRPLAPNVARACGCIVDSEHEHDGRRNAMWWDTLGSWPSWITMTVVMAIAFGGLALLIALALREEHREQVGVLRKARHD